MQRATIGLACVLLGLAAVTACGQDPQEALRQQAATAYEKLDSSYLDQAKAALRDADPLVPTAYELALHALALANSDFANGLKDIAMPNDSKSDAQALVGAAIELRDGSIACEALIASGSVCQVSVLNDWIQTRNGADRTLRKDLRLDPSEVPG